MERLGLILNFLVMIVSAHSYAQQIQTLDISSFLGNTASPLLTYHATAFTFYEPFNILGYQKREEFERRVVFLEDNIQQKFVFKCYGDNQKEEAVCEYLGSFIGASVGVPINKIKIVTGGALLAGLDNGTSLATLHTYVPGKELCKWYETAPNDIILKGGLVSERHLKCLTLSDDLCDIMALDIFLNNKDRHHENCFFDEKAMRYYAIDMGDIFLAVRKIQNIQVIPSDEIYKVFLQMIAREKIVALRTYNFLNYLDAPAISEQQKCALQRVCFTLKNLIVLYSAETILNAWMPIAHAVGYDYTDYKKMYLRMSLERNMYWVHRVVEKIDEIIAV
jgi:hypothetical protein